MNEQVDQNEVETTTEQDSPTVETNTESITAGKPEQTLDEEASDSAQESNQDRNWRALREENERLRQALEIGPEREEVVESNLKEAKSSTVVQPFLSSEDNTALMLEEFKAEQSFPELSSNRIFAKAVEGEYRSELDRYTQKVMYGERAKLPSAFEIARKFKKTWDTEVGGLSKRAEVEGAKRANQAKGAVEATIEADTRSDRGRVVSKDERFAKLQKATREGKDAATVERIMASNL